MPGPCRGLTTILTLIHAALFVVNTPLPDEVLVDPPTLATTPVAYRPCSALSPSGKYRAMTTPEGTVMIWDTALYRIVEVLPGPRHPVGRLHFCGEDWLMATGGQDQPLAVWNVGRNTE